MPHSSITIVFMCLFYRADLLPWCLQLILSRVGHDRVGLMGAIRIGSRTERAGRRHRIDLMAGTTNGSVLRAGTAIGRAARAFEPRILTPSPC